MVNGATCFAWSMVGMAALALAAPGCGDSTPATPRAQVILSGVGPGAAGSAACPLPSFTPWADMPKTNDGDSVNGAGVAVNCKVSGNENDGFNVAAAVGLSGKGTITIGGHLTTARTAQPLTSVSFQSSEPYGPFTGTDCTAQFPSGGGIASGRVWLDLTCPTLVDDQHGKTCKGSATLIFENCAQ
jgi:hypothetical protein